MKRRTFLRQAGQAAAWAGVSVVLASNFSGCYDDDDPTAPTTNPGDVAGQVSSNHGHTVLITAAQIADENDITLTLTSGNGHTHTVTLTAAQVVSLAGGNTVSSTSSSDSGHTHLATFS